MTNEDTYTINNEQENQGDKDPIETWFHTIINPQYSLIIQHLLAPYQSMKLVFHVLISIQVYYSNVNMSMLVILLHTWIH